MLSRKRCPVTGVINFYAAQEPHLPIGSIVNLHEPSVCHWRIYDEGPAIAGSAGDVAAAETALRRRYRDALKQAAEARQAA